MRPYRLSLPGGDASEINLTPMLDVVFIMLVFFIVTSSFVRERGLEARTTESNLIIDPESKAILVRIDNGGGIWIDGLAVDVRAVRAHIERLHSLDPAQPVVVQTAGQSTTELLVSVIDAARQAGIEDVAVVPEN